IARAAGAGDPVALASHTRLLRLAPGVSVTAALRRLRTRSDVVWAVPDFRAHAADGLIPNDRGDGSVAGDWQSWKWSSAGPSAVTARRPGAISPRTAHRVAGAWSSPCSTRAWH